MTDAADVLNRAYYDSQVKTLIHRDPDKGFVIERWQDCEAIVENNKRLRNERQRQPDWGLHHIASIPNVVWEKWMNEEGVNLYKLKGDELSKFIARKRADPDWRYLFVG